MRPGASLSGLLSGPVVRERFLERLGSRISDTQHPRLITVPPAAADIRSESQVKAAKLAIKKGDSAVLVPLVEDPVTREPHALLTHRSYKLRSHRGEICFPGGKIDEGESIQEAALREAEEEVGIDPSAVAVWGTLKPILTRMLTNLINPVVGIVDSRQLEDLHPRTKEVQTVFMVPLSEMAQPQNRRYTFYSPSKKLNYTLPVYLCRNYKVISHAKDAYLPPDGVYRIWGISGVILHETLASLLPPDKYNADIRQRS
ncbi:Protein NDX-3 [Aphelenchoides avenae]|nr:Protein NDX-3 [Aphelenchus avenae]